MVVNNNFLNYISHDIIYLRICVDSQLSDSGLRSFTQVLNANRVMELKSSEGLTGLYVQENASEWLGEMLADDWKLS